MCQSLFYRVLYQDDFINFCQQPKRCPLLKPTSQTKKRQLRRAVTFPQPHSLGDGMRAPLRPGDFRTYPGKAVCLSTMASVLTVESLAQSEGW